MLMSKSDLPNETPTLKDDLQNLKVTLKSLVGVCLVLQRQLQNLRGSSTTYTNSLN